MFQKKRQFLKLNVHVLLAVESILKTECVGLRELVTAIEAIDTGMKNTY